MLFDSWSFAKPPNRKHPMLIGMVITACLLVASCTPETETGGGESETMVQFVLRSPLGPIPLPDGEFSWSACAIEPCEFEGEAAVATMSSSQAVEVTTGGSFAYWRLESDPVQHPSFDEGSADFRFNAFGLGWSTECEFPVTQGQLNTIVFDYTIVGCEGESVITYRLPYEPGTDVVVSRDDLSHFSGSVIEPELDLVAQPAGDPHLIVAAADGVVQAIVDSNEEPTDSNNYVWISHQLGVLDDSVNTPFGEWTKYSHVRTDSVPDEIVVGDAVEAGTVLGVEGNVGESGGQHLHFEVAVPDDWFAAIDSAGFVISSQEALIPKFCGLHTNKIIDGFSYTASSCGASIGTVGGLVSE